MGGIIGDLGTALRERFRIVARLHEMADVEFDYERSALCTHGIDRVPAHAYLDAATYRARGEALRSAAKRLAGEEVE